jgi:hypothetical protein
MSNATLMRLLAHDRHHPAQPVKPREDENWLLNLVESIPRRLAEVISREKTPPSTSQ